MKRKDVLEIHYHLSLRILRDTEKESKLLVLEEMRKKVEVLENVKNDSKKGCFI